MKTLWKHGKKGGMSPSQKESHLMNANQRSLILGLMVLWSVVAVACWILLAGTPVQASPPGSEYQFLLGSALGPDFPEETLSMAADGSTIELKGQGSFTLGPGKSISGGGTYTIWNAAGDVLFEGDWEATQLEAFHSYGNNPDCCPPEWEGGKMNAKIELEGLGAASLTVWCALGPKVPTGVIDEVRVDIGSWHFDEIANDFSPTVFVRLAD